MISGREEQVFRRAQNIMVPAFLRTTGAARQSGGKRGQWYNEECAPGQLLFSVVV